MGKIFDALQKASKQSMHKAGSLKEKSRATSNDLPGQGNVVSFADLKKSQPGLELDPNMVAFHNPQSVEAELFKVLRTNLLFPSKGEPPKSIMVTSAIPGEGKSLVSANLAVSIAQGIEEHVLLIDSDLRKPSINKYFGIDQTLGLSEYLTSGLDVSQNFAKTHVEKLTILPAGAPPDNPTELLTTQKMKTLLSEVTRRYEDRYIIIDSAPPSIAPETAALANHVDGIILVACVGKAPRSMITEVIEQLGKKKILGFVLNRSDGALRKYYGFGKSYYMQKTK